MALLQAGKYNAPHLYPETKSFKIFSLDGSSDKSVY